MASQKGDATTKGLKELLVSLSYTTNYMTLKRCLNLLKEELYASGELDRPVKTNKRGRPKKLRPVESEGATLDSRKNRKPTACRTCQ